jgi:3-oxoacyl-[acyl-carrier protein] reductase
VKLEDKVAIVTGAGRGIGRGIAMAFAREGARLALVSRTASQVEAAAREARDLGAEAFAVPADVADPDDVRRMVDETLERYSRIDILVNNAAVLGPVGPHLNNDMEQWADAIRINVIGLALCTHAVLPAMIEQGGGKIVNLSGAGVTGPLATVGAYCTSKAAVTRFTENLALEVREHDIWVNLLGPGQIDTHFLDPLAEAEAGMVDPDFQAMVRRTRSGLGASLDNAAAAAVWLASPESDGLSGRTIFATRNDWSSLAPRIPEIMSSDLYTLRFMS